MANLVATHYPFPSQCANAFVAVSKLRKGLRPSGNCLPTLNEFACTMLECRGKVWHLPCLLEMMITAGRYSFRRLASILELPLHKFTEEQSCLEDSPNLQPQSGIDSVPSRIDHFVSSPSSTFWLAQQQFLLCKPPTSCSSDVQPLVILMSRSLSSCWSLPFQFHSDIDQMSWTRTLQDFRLNQAVGLDQVHPGTAIPRFESSFKSSVLLISSKTLAR